MNLFKKTIIAIVTVCLVVGISSFLIARFLPESDFLKGVIENKLNEVTGRQVSIGSVQVRFGFPSLINVVVQNLVIKDINNRELFYSGAMRLNVGLWGLLAGNPSLDNLKISSARLKVYRDSSGKIESVFSRKTAGVTGSQAPLQPEQSRESAKETPLPGAAPAPPSPKVAAGRKLSWPIRHIQIESSQITLEDSSVGSEKPLRTSFENISGNISRQENVFDFQVAGKPNCPGVESSQLAMGGSIKVGPELSSIEFADINSKLETVKLVNPYFLPRKMVPWINKLEINKLSLNTHIRQGAHTRIDFSAGVFQTKDSPGLQFTASAMLTPDFSRIEGLRLKGVSDDVHIVNMARVVPKEVLDRFGPDGAINISFDGSWSRDSGLSIAGSAGLHDFHTPGKYAFLGKQLSTSMDFELTSDSFVIKELKVQNEASNSLMSINGTVNGPFASDRSLNLNARVNLEGAWLSHLGMSSYKDLILRGPIPVYVHLKGAPKDLKVDLNGDLTGAALSLKSVFEKEIGVKARIEARTAVSLDSSKPLSNLLKQIDIKFKTQDATIKLAAGFQPIANCPLNLDAEISGSKGLFDLKNFSMKISLPGNKHTLIFTRGYVNRLNSQAPDLNIEGNLNLNRELVNLLGLPSKASVDMTGAANLNFKVTGSPNSLKWSLGAPLKGVSFTIGDWFVKKAGVDLDVTLSGTRTPGEVHLGQARIKTPGFLGGASGEISNKPGQSTSFKLDVDEAEIGTLASFFPSLGQSGFSGPVRGSLAFNGLGKEIPTSGRIQLVSVNYRPHKSPVTFEKINGTVYLKGNSIDSNEIRGYVHGTIEAPVKASLKFAGLENLGSLNGKISLSAGPGKLSVDRLRSVLNQAQSLIEPFLNENGKVKKFNPFELKSATADVLIDAGTLRTEDVKIRASGLSIGAIGSANLKSHQIDILSYIRTSAAPLSAIGTIPMVKDIIKKNEGLLKITGLDKELKKLGIENSQKQQSNEREQTKKEHDLNVIVKISGLWAEPTLMPVLETSLPRNQVNQLKELMN
ncbi:MAG: AsmA-like C-terminal region-containing protein [Desulfomonilaceae bacterium]